MNRPKRASFSLAAFSCTLFFTLITFDILPNKAELSGTTSVIDLFTALRTAVAARLAGFKVSKLKSTPGILLATAVKDCSSGSKALLKYFLARQLS